MNRTILKLWNGELCPASRSGLNNSKVRMPEARMACCRDAMKERLEDGQLRAFEQYISCVREYYDELIDQAFVDGYSMGTRITAEALLEAEEIDH